MLTREYSLESVIHSDQVPTLPEVAVEILRVAQQSEPSPDELVRIIRMDPAIAGRIVRFANSPLFGICRTSATIESAVVLLGTTMIRTLVLGFSLAKHGPASESLQHHFQQIWRETLFQASAAELLGERHSGVDPAVWFLAGLLQDAGRLVMLNVFGDEYVGQVIQGDESISLSDRESQAFGFSHAEVSAALCRMWNLGGDLFRAITTHHSPHSDTTNSPASIDDALRAATVCNQYMEAVSDHPESGRHQLEYELMYTHGCRPDEIVEVLAEMDVRSRGLAAVFKADVGNMPSRESLLEKAQATLFEIALSEQLRRLNRDTDNEAAVSMTPDHSLLDEETGAFRQDLLHQILPQQIAAGTERENTLGLLSIELETTDQVSDADPMRQVADAVRCCIRPHDQIIRSSEKGLIVLLPELGIDMLTKVAGRITECCEQTLGEAAGSVSTGGIIVIPTGRRPASIKSVLSGLQESLKQAAKTGCEQFHILQGRKLHAVQQQG